MKTRNYTEIISSPLPNSGIFQSSPNSIEDRILLVRGVRILVDKDLAELYSVTTKRLNEQVKRNEHRFPEDFLFQLNQTEKYEVVANCDHLARLKYSKSLPWAFTEYGALMAASVLNSKRAIEVSLYVIRAFVRLRQLKEEYIELAARIGAVEKTLSINSDEIAALIRAVNDILSPTRIPPERQIGFRIPK